MRQGKGWQTAIGAALLALAVPLVPAAHAEGSFFDFLFGKSSEPAPAPRRAPPPRDPRPRVRTAPPSRPQTTARKSQPTPITKADFVVAVFGDAFAVSVTRGLNDSDPAGGSRQALDRSSDDAGLNAMDVPAWDKAIEAARTQAGRIDTAVVLLGSNDGEPLTDAQGRKQAPGTPGWRQLYGDQVARLADEFRDKHVPLIWMGLPIVRDSARARLYAAINEVVQDRATREGATFVDTWQPFADENGDFTAVGPDVDGRPATLRWTNGWNFTRAGAKKLASFLLPDLARLRDRAHSTRDLTTMAPQNAEGFDQALAIDVNAQILREAGLPVPGIVPRAAKQPGPVLVLTASPVTTGGVLAIIQPSRSADPPGAIHSGRADDFTWPKR